MNHVYFLYTNILWNNGCLQNKKIGTKLLWKNPNPTNEFIEQFIDNNADGYSLLFIEFRTYTTVGQNISMLVSNIENQAYRASNITSSSAVIRVFEIKSTTRIWFDDAVFQDQSTNDNKALIPLRIYGIK